jgi:hypothetical protein
MSYRDEAGVLPDVGRIVMSGNSAKRVFELIVPGIDALLSELS